jgi:hypothetical protein
MINIAYLTVRTGTSWAERENCGQTTSETTIDTECVEVRGYAKYDVIGPFLRFTMKDTTDICYLATKIEEFVTSIEEE